MKRQFKLTIDIENEAFEPNPVIEIRRILRAVADSIGELDSADLRNYQNARDVNGNIVCRFAIKRIEE